MSTFGGLILTNRGRNLQSKAQAGVQLQYTRIGVGDGILGSTSILSLNALINEIMSLDITKLKTLGDVKAVIGTVLTNQDMVEGFYFREIGLFATDPDIGEILYCYGNAGDLAEYISPGGGSDIIEKGIDIQTVIGNAQNVSAVINESLVFATKEDFENIQVPVTSVNQKIGDVVLFASDIQNSEGRTVEWKLSELSIQTDELEHNKIDKTLATTASQFLISSGIGTWIVKTVAEIKTLLGLGSAAYTESSNYTSSSHVGTGGTAHALVTTTAHGFMSATDKEKLDSMEINNLNVAKVHNTLSQSIANGVKTALTFDSEDFDYNNIHGTGSRLTVKKAGKYLVIAKGKFASSEGGVRQLILRKNGSLELTRDVLIGTKNISTENITSTDYAIGDGGNLSAAFDRNTSTAWATSVSPSDEIDNAYIGQLFPLPKVIGRIRMDASTEYYTPSSFALQSSDDGVNWYTIKTFSVTYSSNGYVTWTTVDFPGSVARCYWRIVAKANTSGKWTTREVEMYEMLDSAFLNIATLDVANINDYYEVLAYQNSKVALNIDEVEFMIVRVG